MAIVHFVNYKRGTQSRAAMRGVMLYVMQEKKTAWEGEPLVSGINCQPQSVYDDFINTKLLYHKDGGVMFYHMVQSFPKGAAVDPRQAHEAARRLAEYFDGCEVLVCTHVDREHIHSHCVINSVNFETGKKLHMAKEQIQELMRRNDMICQEMRLPVFDAPTQQARGMSGAEYHTALKGQSWKLRLMNTIDECMKYAADKDAFVSLMESEGYQVRWESGRKYITYTTPEGMRYRDNKLHEEKYCKEAMEREFRIRAELVKRKLHRAAEIDGGIEADESAEQRAGKYTAGARWVLCVRDKRKGGRLMEQEKGAVYCRLSQDDGSAGESGSIQTQRTLLTQYCKEHSIQIVDYYCDDGWSGTNFERPEFKRMIDDIENGKINTVIVKDLSRFGREYAQMGLYIEHYFEEKGIRFIAVAEGIDSKRGLDNLMLPMTNVINSLYARQASTKTKAAHRARAGSGMFIGSRAPFGYQKDPDDRHHLIVDPEAAEVVKSIFQMFADGIGYVRMTKILRGKQILNPQAYFNQNNPDYYKNSDYWRKPFDWHATSVRAILNNPVYLGKIVFGRTKTKGFFDKHRIAADESEWVVSENTHEPLITQDLWDTVHQMMQARCRENSTGEVQPFAGLVKCADCGSSLNVSYDKRKGRYTGFSCWVYKNYGKERCTSHAIGWKTLNQLVLEDIRRNALDAHRNVADYMDMLLAIEEE